MINFNSIKEDFEYYLGDLSTSARLKLTIALISAFTFILSLGFLITVKFINTIKLGLPDYLMPILLYFISQLVVIIVCAILVVYIARSICYIKD